MPQLLRLTADRSGVLYAVTLMFVAFVFLTGGASRADAQSQLLVRLLSIAAGAFALAGSSRSDVARVRAPLMFLGAAAALNLLHLIPLPPDMWTRLPGRAAFADLLRVANVGHVWRPLSLAPDRTLNSLLALLPPVAAVLLVARLRSEDSRRLLAPLIALVMVSGLIGLLQLSSGLRELYFYRITNYGSAVGLFANRNHQGLLLAMALPMLAVFAAGRSETGFEARKLWLAIGLGVFIIPLILVTGSRAALALALIAFVAGFLLHGPLKLQRKRRGYGRGRLLVASMWVGGVALVGITAISSRAIAFERLFTEDVSQEIRVKLFAPMVEMGNTYFPLGAGLGSFVDVFRMHEPLASLDVSYVNHAHNELMELWIDGGIPSLALLGAFLIWWSWRAISVWTRTPPSEGRLFARLGVVLTGLVMLASLADYPLRTATVSVVFAIALCWMAAPIRRTARTA